MLGVDTQFGLVVGGQHVAGGELAGDLVRKLGCEPLAWQR